MIKKKVLVVSGREELMQQSPLTLKTRGELIRYASADVHREPTKCSGDLKARNTKGSRDALPKAFTCFAGSGIIILQINFFICFFFLALHCFCLLLLCFTFAFTVMIVFLFCCCRYYYHCSYNHIYSSYIVFIFLIFITIIF